jgi:DNA (cytosine-5)-methyltransferase 1
MRYLSMFSGIEAASVAWHPLGWECVGVAEIEPFPCAVLAHHYPDVPNLGSITDEQIAALGPFDLVVGGSPCQDLSVAGKRAGLAGARSGLFHEQLRIFHAARTLCVARWLLWENVPGAFSSHGGQDFAVVVGAMAGTGFAVPKGKWQKAGVAVGSHGLVEWRTLDAQYVRVESHPRAVPQRRRRVFALLDTGDWSSRPPILLEPESLRGDSPPRRETGEGAASRIVGRSDGGGFGTDSGGVIPSVSLCLNAGAMGRISPSPTPSAPRDSPSSGMSRAA